MISLMYHDVVTAGREDSSGFLGKGAGVYKLGKEPFRLHLEELAQSSKVKVKTVFEALQKQPDLSHTALPHAVALTFDDGGVSAYSIIADMLEDMGWRGHFFVTTGLIGVEGFLSKHQIRALHARGHIIGSHTCTHPTRFTACPWDQQVREFKASIQYLSEVLGDSVTTASLSGGSYSLQLARAAALGGVRYLFTSEPKTGISVVDGCLILGRYGMKSRTRPTTAAAIAAGNAVPRVRQALYWSLKKAVKAVTGKTYMDMRRNLIEGRTTRL